MKKIKDMTASDYIADWFGDSDVTKSVVTSFLSLTGSDASQLDCEKFYFSTQSSIQDICNLFNIGFTTAQKKISYVMYHLEDALLSCNVADILHAKKLKDLGGKNIDLHCVFYSCRIPNCLAAEGIKTTKQLDKFMQSESLESISNKLLLIANFSKKSLSQLLDAYGIEMPPKSIKHVEQQIKYLESLGYTVTKSRQ